MTHSDIFKDSNRRAHDRQVGGRQDLEKVKHYCDLEIARLKKKK